ncbi:hypothetical protein LEMLEM_LOCUS20997, partial [Lemmus lemmus]
NCVQCPRRPEEGIRSPGTGVTDGCDPPCWRWDSNLDPMEEAGLSSDEVSRLPWQLEQVN